MCENANVNDELALQAEVLRSFFFSAPGSASAFLSFSGRGSVSSASGFFCWFPPASELIAPDSSALTLVEHATISKSLLTL
jgi:hypothetical protein